MASGRNDVSMADTTQQPWWLQPLITLITQVGVPTVIAGVLFVVCALPAR